MRVIKADCNKVKGELNRFFSNCVGAGRAGEVMRYVPMKQLERMQEECAFRYIRFHGLFHEEMNVVRYDENGKLKFCFQYIDMLFDALLEHHIRPIVEIGLMPDILAKEEAYVFEWKMNISMPKDINEWSLLVEELVSHLTNRYGRQEIRKWYFEIWNEPNHPAFFTEYKNMESYMTLYKTAANAIKKIDAEYRVGGPATAGVGWIQEFIQCCKDYDIPMDFVSSHVYGVKGDFDSDGKKVLWMQPVEEPISDIIRTGKLCAEHNLPFFITEWSSSYSCLDPVHDSYINAPYMLHIFKRAEGFADILSYWVYTDIFEELGAPVKPFHGGFGLFNVQSIAKPSYYVYCFLNKLGDIELTCEDKDAYVCKSEQGVQILMWNLVQLNQDVDNRKFYIRDLPAKKIENARIEIEGLIPNEQYAIEIETVGYCMGDAYDLYIREKFECLETKEMTEQLKEKSKPLRTLICQRANEKGELSFDLPQSENQVDMIQIFLNSGTKDLLCR